MHDSIDRFCEWISFDGTSATIWAWSVMYFRDYGSPFRRMMQMARVTKHPTVTTIASQLSDS